MYIFINNAAFKVRYVFVQVTVFAIGICVLFSVLLDRT